eukprot:597896-Rhodomonas_salina.1
MQARVPRGGGDCRRRSLGSVQQWGRFRSRPSTLRVLAAVVVEEVPTSISEGKSGCYRPQDFSNSPKQTPSSSLVLRGPVLVPLAAARTCCGLLCITGKSGGETADGKGAGVVCGQG